MSISTLETKITYVGNASNTTPYPITFKYLDPDHVTVYADGVQISNGGLGYCQFGGDGTNNTGEFTTSIAYAATVRIVVALDIPFDQPVVLEETGSLPAKTLELLGLDRLNMQIRRVWRRLGDIPFFTGDEGTGAVGTPNTYLGYDNNGNAGEFTISSLLDQISLEGFENKILTSDDFGATNGTVGQMKTNDLPAKSLFVTKGYYSNDDGGGAIYLIQSAVNYGGTPDELSDHTLDNGRVAALQLSGGRVSPLQFGAKTGVDNDSTASIHAALDAFFDAQEDGYIFDGGGFPFGVESSWIGTNQVYRKQIHNLYLEARSGFTGEAILQFQPANPLHLLNDLKLVNCTLRGNTGQSAAAHCQGLLLLDQTQGVFISDSTFEGATDYCIKDLNTAAAAEVVISNCRIAGNAKSGQYNESVIGVWLAGNDSMINNCIIRECESAILFEKGANSVIGTHVYNFDANLNTYGIICNDASEIQLNGNYIDGVKLLLVKPRDCTITGNKFLLQDGQDWTGYRSFIIFRAVGANQILQKLVITGNQFKCNNLNGLSRPRSIENDFTYGGGGNTYDATQTRNCFVTQNVGRQVDIHTTHYTAELNFSAQTIKSFDLADYGIFGGGYIDAFRAVTSVCLNSSASTAGFRAEIVGSVVYVAYGSSVTGTVYCQVSANYDGQ